MGKEEKQTPPRFVVGIDLGTTNSAITFVDSQKKPWRVRTFAAPQVVAPKEVERRETLPSFHYEPTEAERSAGALQLPWDAESPYAVGFFARDQGIQVPSRLIASAKSWLCHTGVDRTADLLPWQGAEDVERLSPVAASSRYLKHLADAWDDEHPKHPMADQDIVLTIPASFDEVARELTVKAAAQAGLNRILLIEEPQAAFYAWLNKHADDWESRVEPGHKILVCDVGGGTSDFTLIRVRRAKDAKVQFHRVAVGDHLILGGDNLDLAIAHHAEQKLATGREAPADSGKRASGLTAQQWAVLVRNARNVKEVLLGDDPPQRLTVNLPGAGSRLIGGGLQVEVTREEIIALLVEGFFPAVGLEEKPTQRRSGFQEFGLPYAPDPAITRCLAAFLTAHRHAGDDLLDTESGDGDSANDHDPARPDIVLLNGGVFASPLLQQRLLEVLTGWFGTDGSWKPQLLENERLDLAVARGAAYYGMVRRGEGVRIAAGLARTYYIGVESDPPSAICLLPASIEPGGDIELATPQFDLTIAEPVEFPLFFSSTRLTDKPGEMVPIDREQMTSLPPIRTVLQTRKRSEQGTVPVCLHAKLTEIGTIDLWCSEVGGRRSWRLQFDVRSTVQTDIDAHQSDAESEGTVDEETWQQCETLIAETFGPDGSQRPAKLAKQLAGTTGVGRSQWPTSLCRRIWEGLMEFEPGRRRSAKHEARWLNLIGFCLRPGYGLAMDDWRVGQTWSAVQGKLAHSGPQVRNEGWILWRRIGGGLTAGQQQAIAEPLLAPVRGLHRRTMGLKGGGDVMLTVQEFAEVWRLLASLELLPVALKIELGDILLDLFPKRKMQAVQSAIAWSLGRLGARMPLYGTLNTVVSPKVTEKWLSTLLDLADDDPNEHLAIMQLARRTDDRYRDLSEKARNKARQWLDRSSAAGHLVRLVEHREQLDDDEQKQVFGESLPKGLRLSTGLA